MKYLLFAACLLWQCAAVAQAGIFKRQVDVGNPSLSGAISYDKHTKTYTLSGGGYNIWFDRDEFFFAYNQIKGDFVLTANVKLMGAGKDAHRKIGWMVRASTGDNAAHMSAVVHGDGLTALQWRRAGGEAMRDPEQELFAKHTHAQVIQLERKGNTFIMRSAPEGESLQEVGQTDNIIIPDKALAGLIICSHDAQTLETGIAWNVRIEKK